MAEAGCVRTEGRGKKPGPAGRRAAAALAFLWITAVLAGGCAGTPRVAEAGTGPYPEDAIAEQDVVEALREASATDRRVLLMFGANWCSDSCLMHALLTTDERVAPLVEQRYVLVPIDVGPRHGAKWDAEVVRQYGRPFLDRGIPVLVVLDSDGRQLTTRENNPLNDSDHRRPLLVRRFLETWARDAGPGR